MRLIQAILILTAGSLLPGCNPAKSSLATFNSHLESTNYYVAAQYAQGKINKGTNPSGDDLLWTLQTGAVNRLLLNHQQSIEVFDKAEDMLKYYDESKNTVVDSVGSAAVNDNIIPYHGQQYDGIMLNTYKALSFMAQKNNELARVELNRALERQIRAREHFNEEIKKLQEHLDKQDRKSNAKAKAIMDDPKTSSQLSTYYPNLDKFEPYPDFVNPFTTYLAALFFELSGDYEKANNLFKESAGMVANNDYISKELLVTDELISGKTKLENNVWVIFENGLGPVKEEIRFDIPVFIATRRAYYTGIALPRLVSRYPAYPCLMVLTDSGDYQTKQVGDMERVIQTEFKKDFKGIVLRAIAAAAVKTAAQAALTERHQDSSGAILALAVAAYSAATMAADVRIWSSLPKDFQVAKCPIPQNRIIKIAPPGGANFEINIPPCNNAIVYIKIIHAGATPVTEVITF